MKRFQKSVFLTEPLIWRRQQRRVARNVWTRHGDLSRLEEGLPCYLLDIYSLDENKNIVILKIVFAAPNMYMFSLLQKLLFLLIHGLTLIMSCLALPPPDPCLLSFYQFYFTRGDCSVLILLGWCSPKEILSWIFGMLNFC